MSHFSSEFFAGNRKKLREKTAHDLIIVAGNGLLQKIADEAYPFKQDSSFWYLTGCDEPDAVLIMHKNHEYLLIPGREEVREKFDGAVDKVVLSEISGIGHVMQTEDGWKKLAPEIKKFKSFATLHPNPAYIPHYDMYANPGRAALVDKVKSIHAVIELHDIRLDMARLRQVKQPVEIEAITKAVHITEETLAEVSQPDMLKTFEYEYEVEAAIAYGFRKRGGRGHAFEPIVASGKRAVTLHNMKADSPLKGESLLLMDVGAEAYSYASDLTRTVRLKETTGRQEAVHAAVLEAQQYAFSLLKPGVMIREYEKQVEQFIGEKLNALGVIKSMEREAIRKYFPHATSHYLGLDTHDAGDYEQPLQPGVVLAVEPGIYLPDEGIGVRIEDNVVITEDGIKVLSDSLKRTL